MLYTKIIIAHGKGIGKCRSRGACLINACVSFLCSLTIFLCYEMLSQTLYCLLN